MKRLFIVNPKAGRGAALKVWQRIEPLVYRDGAPHVVIPDSEAATRQAAADAVQAGVDRVIVVGGDGTLLTVAGALANTGTSVGIIPAGTGNDFCRTSGISRRPETALAVALGPDTRRIDMGQVSGGRYFLNAAGIGFDGEVAKRASGYPDGLGGTLPYLLGAVTTLFRYRPIAAEVTVDGQRYAGPMTMIAVANGNYYGGGMKIAPEASRQDGLLDVYVAEGMAPLQMLNLLPRVYTGGHVHSPRVKMFRGRQVEVKLGAPAGAHVDGEPFTAETLTFTASPQALLVAMPSA